MRSRPMPPDTCTAWRQGNLALLRTIGFSLMAAIPLGTLWIWMMRQELTARICPQCQHVERRVSYNLFGIWRWETASGWCGHGPKPHSL